MVFEVYNEAKGVWYDLVEYWAFDTLDSTDNDIDGPNAGRNQRGTMIRDYLATKMKWNFQSIPLTRPVANNLLEAVRPETFTVRTDIVDGVTRRYTCYSNNRVLHYILRRRNGTEYVKVSFPIIEM